MTTSPTTPPASPLGINRSLQSLMSPSEEIASLRSLLCEIYPDASEDPSSPIDFHSASTEDIARWIRCLGKDGQPFAGSPSDILHNRFEDLSREFGVQLHPSKFEVQFGLVARSIAALTNRGIIIRASTRPVPGEPLAMGSNVINVSLDLSMSSVRALYSRLSVLKAEVLDNET